jgi:hypothetical protein
MYKIVNGNFWERVKSVEIIRAKAFARVNLSLDVAGDLVRGGNCHYRW